MSGDATTREDSLRTAVDAMARSDDDLDPLVGTVLGGFRVDAVLGAGGNGVVYRAWDSRLDRPVALKVMKFDSPRARTRFRREARAQAALRHPNVVAVHTIEEIAGLTCLVMDLVAGGSLSDAFAREGPLPQARVLAVAEAVASALGAAHAAGLVHRDVKPSNVLLETDGRILLADFGLAKEMSDEGEGGGQEAPAPRSLTQGVVGTPAYLAPEQARGERVDHRADMYALGVTMYELLSGKRPPAMPIVLPGDPAPPMPPEPEPLRAIAPSVSPEVDALVMKLIARAPDARPASWDAVIAMVRAARGSEEVVATIPRRAVAFAVDLLIAVLVLGTIATVLAKGARAVGVGEHPVDLASRLGFWPFCAVSFGVLESLWGTSVGKRLLSLRVVADPGSDRPSLVRGIARSVVRFAPLELFALVKEAAGKLPSGVPGGVLMALTLVSIAPALRADRRTVADLVARARVVLRVKP